MAHPSLRHTVCIDGLGTAIVDAAALANQPASLLPSLRPLRPTSDIYPPNSHIKGTTSFTPTSDPKSILSPSTSSRTMVVPMRIVRRVPSTGNDEAIRNSGRTTKGSGRPLTWPSVSRIRKSVSTIFNTRKDHLSTSKTPRSPTTARTVTPHHTTRARSASLSGLTSALVAMEGVSESDTDTDEIAREARGVVEAIRERWVFEEVVRVGGAEAWRKPWQ